MSDLIAEVERFLADGGERPLKAINNYHRRLIRDALRQLLVLFATRTNMTRHQILDAMFDELCQLDERCEGETEW
jgi:hypothetical protein